ncbi:MAG: N-acetylmuramoyl-L-alanine amidase, partial [Bacteriovoracaceae bacterium]
DAVKADLFISIHFNSSGEKSSHGFETYYLDNHADAAIKKVENVENKYLQGADKIVNQILIDLVIQKTVVSSKKLANLVHGRIKRTAAKTFKMRDRGIKPGLFYVLALSKRPGILVEAGFMSHQDEIWTLRKGKFLHQYAQAIADGVQDYFKGHKEKELPLF